LQKKLVVISLQPEAGVAVGMIVSVQAVVNVAQRTKDVVVHQVDSVRVGIPVIVPLIQVNFQLDDGEVHQSYI
jgi:hypothetical protein